jgi:hypothetical protein
MLWLVVLVVLHSPDGSEIVVSENEVVSMRGTRDDEPSKHFPENVHCMINTSDGKFIAVSETCADVMRIFVDEERREK